MRFGLVRAEPSRTLAAVSRYLIQYRSVQYGADMPDLNSDESKDSRPTVSSCAVGAGNIDLTTTSE